MSVISRHPPGFHYIIANEIAERFSYYGMRSVLVIFMTTQLLDRSGALSTMNASDATLWYHLFGVGNYLFPLFGALIADVVWGKYRTIIALSLVYCAGHLVMSLDSTRFGLAIGLFLIALGAGGIKPCVSAHVGDQYRGYEARTVSEGYSLFYVAINVGAGLSSLTIPWVLAHYGPHVAFAIPGVWMALATLMFWCGRNRYVRVSPTPFHDYVRELRKPSSRATLLKLARLFIAISMFWALFDQMGSSWVLQAQRMQRRLSIPGFGSFELLASQLQAINPILILIAAPIFSIWVYPWFERRRGFSLRTRIVVGLVLSGVSFLCIALAQHWIALGETVSIGWQVLAYVILTIAEVLVSVTSLEIAYTHAPRVSTSLVTSFYLLAVALGNGVAALYNGICAPAIGGPESAMYFLIFSALPMIGALVICTIRLGSSNQEISN